jgi:hypothetical protein
LFQCMSAFGFLHQLAAVTSAVRIAREALVPCGRGTEAGGCHNSPVVICHIL